MADDRITLREITLRRVHIPLLTPYRLSYRVFEAFEPIIVEVRDGGGRSGWGEGHIAAGSSAETQDGGWAFCRAHAENAVGRPAAEAKAAIGQTLDQSPVAATAMLTAIEMLEDSALLRIQHEARLPLLVPINSLDPEGIRAEVERRLEEGFRTFKVKVGTDVDADLARVFSIQEAASGRAALRLDANRGYGREDGCRFAAALDADGIALFEQPCAAEDWDANAAVARASTVPLMLDEPICGLGDIERAAGIEGIGLCKVKLKRFGSLERLERALDRIRERGMEPVLGDGLAGEVGCWMEACVARSTIRNAGEFNGFLKSDVRLFEEPLVVEAGALVLGPGPAPRLDRARLAAHTRKTERFAAA